jgi:hypothetical protein
MKGSVTLWRRGRFTAVEPGELLEEAIGHAF